MNNISKFFLNNVIKNPDKKIIGEKINKKWKWYTQNDLNNKVIYCREKLLDLNINCVEFGNLFSWSSLDSNIS